MNQFSRYLNEKGLRHARPREIVAQEFFKCSEHVGVDKLLKRVQKIEPNIGIATVYRTLHLLVDAGLALKRDFSTGIVTYEKNPESHHDHLICTQCGHIIEFHHDRIEELQDQVASKYKFRLQHHKMELYGVCSKCISS